MHALTLQAELDGVTDLKFNDSPQDPYILTFKVQCTSCREVHPNWVTFNQYETHDISGSRGDANFVFRCKLCGRESSATARFLNKLYTVEDSGKPVKLLELDTRGLEFVEFKPDGAFSCKGTDSGYPFAEFDLQDGEWFDYDEKASQEVSITDIKWLFVKA